MSGAAIFRPAALAFQRCAGVRGDVLRITSGWLSAATWLVVSIAVCASAFLCTAQVDTHAQGPALVLLANRRDVTAARSGVVVEIATHLGAHVQRDDVLVRLASSTEHSELTALERALDDQLVLLLRNPSDHSARDAVLQLRTRRDVAQAAVEHGVLRAPCAGEVSDLRVRPGQLVEAGAPLIALQAEPRTATVTALLPGAERPRLHPGMPLRLHLKGFERAVLELSIERVDEQILGPAEALRALGAELAGALEVTGPVVLVHARIPASGFRARGNWYRLHHGLPASAEVAVERESLLVAWLPGLGDALHDLF